MDRKRLITNNRTVSNAENSIRGTALSDLTKITLSLAEFPYHTLLRSLRNNSPTMPENLNF